MFYIEKTVEAVSHEKLKEQMKRKFLFLKLRRQKNCLIDVLVSFIWLSRGKIYL